eukprot:6504955-Prymnesium_polylepis.1
MRHNPFFSVLPSLPVAGGGGGGVEVAAAILRPAHCDSALCPVGGEASRAKATILPLPLTRALPA